MRYCFLAILLLLIYSCARSLKLDNSYSLGLNTLRFDTVNKTFSFLERGELSFFAYSEGEYIKVGKYIYLTSKPKDSAIKYEIIPGDGMGGVKLHCTNFDERVPIIYRINGQTFNSSQSDFSYAEYFEDKEAEVLIKIPFPRKYSGSCYKKFDTLYSSIVLDSKIDKQKGLKVKFSIDYNYFNWVSLTDTLELVNKHTLKSLKSGYVYRNSRGLENDSGVNYLSRCML